MDGGDRALRDTHAITFAPNCGLLTLDEIGFRPPARIEANLFFRLVFASMAGESSLNCVENHRAHIGTCRCSQRELEGVPLIQGRCNYTCEQPKSRINAHVTPLLTF